jgi:hypothetical protein
MRHYWTFVAGLFSVAAFRSMSAFTVSTWHASRTPPGTLLTVLFGTGVVITEDPSMAVRVKASGNK